MQWRLYIKSQSFQSKKIAHAKLFNKQCLIERKIVYTIGKVSLWNNDLDQDLIECHWEQVTVSQQQH